MNQTLKCIFALSMAMLCGQAANAAELTVTNVAKVEAAGVQFDVSC